MCIASSRRSRCGRTAWFRQAGQIATTPEALRAFADSLLASDEVAVEATGNTHAIAELIAPRVARVAISNPMKTRAIAEAKVKTDKVDAKVLCQLLAADYLPVVWMADEPTQGSPLSPLLSNVMLDDLDWGAGAARAPVRALRRRRTDLRS